MSETSPPPQAPAYPSTNPPAAPPGPSGAPPQGGNNGLSIAAFVLALLGSVPLGIGLGIAGLVQARKRNQKRGLAIAAIVISGLWLVALAIGAIVVITADSNRDANGTVTTAGSELATKIRTGDCVNGIGGATRVTDVAVVPCAQPHEGEVVGEKDLTGSAFPGDAAVEKAANDACPELLKSYAGEKADSVELMFLHPTADSWRLNDRTISCVALHKTPEPGSLKG